MTEPLEGKQPRHFLAADMDEFWIRQKDVYERVAWLKVQSDKMRLVHRADKRDYEGCDAACEYACRMVRDFQKLVDSAFGAATGKKVKENEVC